VSALAVPVALALTLITGAPASAATNVKPPLESGSYALTSYFGYRCQPTAGASTFHEAIDLGARDGTPIYAMAAGKVTAASSYGTPYLTVDYGVIDGEKITVTYMHMWNPLKHVNIGQTVKAGQKIAEVGNAGVSTGAHLHFSLRVNGVTTEPLKWLLAHGVDIKKGAYSVWADTTNTLCTYYANARTALKSSPDNLSKNAAMVAKGDKVTMKPNGIVKGFYEVTYNGKKGYVHMNRLNASKLTANQPNFTPTKSAAGVTYTPIYGRHIFDYPSTTEAYRGVLDTIDKGELFTTTGKKHGRYEEIIYGGFRGWMVLDEVKKVQFTNSSANGVTESVTQNLNGTVTIKGYAYDRDTPNKSIKVNYFIDGKKIKWEYANLKRTDAQSKVATSTSTPNIGYNWTSPLLTPGKHNIRVQVLNADGTKGNHRTIYNKDITISKGQDPAIHVDRAYYDSNNKLVLTGWAFDADTPGDSIKVRFTVNGNTATVVANKKRSDILARNPGKISTDKVGFWWVSNGTYKGKNAVKVEALNAANGKNVTKLNKTLVNTNK